jgi:ribosomal protein S18 acetylase RimI-like enzyme
LSSKSEPLVIRDATERDLPFIESMLFQCLHWEEALEPPARAQLRTSPEIERLLAGWGRAGDVALVAERSGSPLGAAWYRFWSNAERGRGFFNARVPELTQAVLPAHRRQGVGRALLAALVDRVLASEAPGLSLSVDPRNPALELYERTGFLKVEEVGGAWTMVLDAPLARLVRR